MAYATTAVIVSDAYKQLGLGPAGIADPFSTSDTNVIQMTALLNSLGRKLTLEHEWQQLVTLYTFDTANGTQAYALPADFNKMLNSSSWNRTTRFPVAGPMSGQAWEYLQALPNAATITLLFMQNQDQFLVYPTPSSVQTIAYEYLSSYWVAPAGTRTLDKTTASSDVLYFDPELLVLGLKLEFLGEKGFPTAKALDDFTRRLEQVKNRQPAPTLSVVGENQVIPLLDGYRNVPYTGYGS
jgi:hypothetical protein